jgi:AcrR family transcriptional regulator
MQVFESIRKNPRQQRAQKTVATILEAAVQVIDRQGYDAATTNHIAERAGVSVGTLYQYFSNKEEIITALMQSYRVQLAETVVRELEHSRPGSLSETVREVIRALIKSHLVSAQARSFVTQTRLASQRSRPGEGPFAQLLKSKLEEAIEEKQLAASGVGNDVGMFVLITAVIGVVQNTVIHDPALLNDPELEHQLVRLVCRYLEIAQP